MTICVLNLKHDSYIFLCNDSKTMTDVAVELDLHVFRSCELLDIGKGMAIASIDRYSLLTRSVQGLDALEGPVESFV